MRTGYNVSVGGRCRRELRHHIEQVNQSLPQERKSGHKISVQSNTIPNVQTHRHSSLPQPDIKITPIGSCPPSHYRRQPNTIHHPPHSPFSASFHWSSACITCSSTFGTADVGSGPCSENEEYCGWLLVVGGFRQMSGGHNSRTISTYGTKTHARGLPSGEYGGQGLARDDDRFFLFL